MSVRLVPQRPVRVLSPQEFAARLRTFCTRSAASWVVSDEAAPALLMSSPHETPSEAPATASAASPSPPLSEPDSDLQEVSPWSSKKPPPTGEAGSEATAHAPARKTASCKAGKGKKSAAGTKRQRTIEDFLARRR
ncbi:uncharacterized protein Tco025E_03321 [Trypanosoma conorhini]|uniref:Uncharacterized protein n=1 Tax=Trypanosoma conorhini TaxID=83891 RepID=A0A422PWH6_9TRYP|nr:uncharacterized protein Tco025E_03321 [Trypanosoma conorhini]RNF22038.1 hypothetical protein Tco025E_03321 [Trypanosoma conorhini]